MKMCNIIIGGQKNFIFYSMSIMVLLFCAERNSIAAQLTAPLISDGSIYESMNLNNYGSYSTVRMGQDDVPAASNRFERGYAIFDLRSFPTDADISQVRFRFDCTWVDTSDPDGTMFYAEIGPLRCSKATWDSLSLAQRYNHNYSDFYSRSYMKQLFGRRTYADVYLWLGSSAISTIKDRAGDYVVFQFRLTTQNEGVPWSGDGWHSDTQVPDWARQSYGWDIYNLSNTIDDDWLAVFSDLRLVIDYTEPELPELSNPTMNTFNGNPETDFYYYIDYYHAGGEAPSIKHVYIDNDSGHNMSLISGTPSNGTYRYGPINLGPGDHTAFFYFVDPIGYKVFSPTNGEWTMPFVGPYKATNPSPSNGANNQSINVDIGWSNGGGATSYDVYFGTDETPDNGEYIGNQTSESYDPGPLEPGTTYYWQIDSKKAGYDTTTGDVWHFTTEPVSIPPNMTVSPSDGLSSSGQEGGPFSPSGKTYTVKNTGGGTLSWSVSKTKNWVSLSKTGGSLGAGQSTTMTVSINSNANSLPAGSHSDTVSFTNNTNGQGNTNRSVSLSVEPETGSLVAVIQPHNVRDAGAQWRVDGGPWIDSGYFQHGLSVGQHTVGFKSVSGWNTPSDQTVQIEADEITYVTGTYYKVQPMITSITPNSGPIGSFINIAGTDFGSTKGSVTFGGTESSEYLSWTDTEISCRVPQVSSGGEVVSDDFEDGVIDTSLWVVGGGARDWRTDVPIGSGNWNYSQNEVVDSADGYLSMRVWGPTSGGTYGAEAWVRTTYNFNDGKTHLINFTWEADIGIGQHYDYYHIQITDGYIPSLGSVHWPSQQPAGTVDLLCHDDGSGNLAPGASLTSGMPKSSWSIEIHPNGISRLYDGPDGTGTLLHEANLDTNYEWYVRFMVIDATSSGFPAGDDRLNLYDFHANTESDFGQIPVVVHRSDGAMSNSVPFTVESEFYLPADIDNDYVISISEIVSYINKWAAGEVTISDVVKAINLWAAGHYYWDEDEQRFKPGE